MHSGPAGDRRLSATSMYVVKRSCTTSAGSSTSSTRKCEMPASRKRSRYSTRDCASGVEGGVSTPHVGEDEVVVAAIVAEVHVRGLARMSAVSEGITVG